MRMSGLCPRTSRHYHVHRCIHLCMCSMLVLDQWFQTLVVNCSPVVIYPKSGEVKPATKFWLLQVDVLHGSKLGVRHGPEKRCCKTLSVHFIIFITLFNLFIYFAILQGEQNCKVKGRTRIVHIFSNLTSTVEGKS